VIGECLVFFVLILYDCVLRFVDMNAKKKAVNNRCCVLQFIGGCVVLLYPSTDAHVTLQVAFAVHEANNAPVVAAMAITVMMIGAVVLIAVDLVAFKQSLQLFVRNARSIAGKC